MEIDTPGGVIRGYWAMGRLISAIPPISVMRTESTVAKIGRSMKNREITIGPLSRGQRTEKQSVFLSSVLRPLTVVAGGRAGERRHRNLLGPDLHARADL